MFFERIKDYQNSEVDANKLTNMIFYKVIKFTPPSKRIVSNSKNKIDIGISV